MKTITIIGNGFDLAHGLPTGFNTFIQSNPALFPTKYNLFKDNDGSWNNIESIYGEQLCNILESRSLHDVTEVVEQIIEIYGFNEYGEVDYYNYISDAFEDEYKQINRYIELLSEFECDFKSYLLEKCGSDRLKNLTTYKKIREILLKSSRIINFNYTDTVETAYGVKNVDHIHGSINNSIAIGSGTLDHVKYSLIDDRYPSTDMFEKSKYGLQEMMLYYEYDDEGNRHQSYAVQRFFNEVVEAATEQETEVLSLLDIKNKDALASRISIIESLKIEHYDRVYIIGHSLSEADYAVFNAINKDADVVCYYRSESRKAKMESVLKKLGFHYTMIHNSEVYQ